MASKYPTNKQRTNYARLCRAIIDLSADVLRELLKKQILLTDISTELKKIPQKVTEKISKEQWGYIDQSATGGTYIKQFDVTLLCLVLRIISVRDLAKTLETTIGYQALYTSVQHCPALSSDPNTKLKASELKEVQIIAKHQQFIQSKDELLWKLYTHLCPVANQKLVHPSVPWGGPNMPNPADTTIGDDIERLRCIRNKTYGHLTSTDMPDKEFNSCWENLEEIMIRMDQELPGNNFKACLDDMKTESMDADIHKELFDTLKIMAETEEKMQKELAEKQEKVTKIQENIATKQDRVERLQENIATKQDRVETIQESVAQKQNQVLAMQKNVLDKQEKVVESQAGIIKEIREEFQQSKEQVKKYEGHTTLQMERHKKDRTFVATNAVSTGLDILIERGILIYSGLPGQGKTTNALEVITQCQKMNPDYKFFELDDVRDWKKIIDPNVPSIVLLNDVIGKTNIDNGVVNDGDKYFPNILANVQEGKVKVVMTIRKLLLDKNRLKLERYKLFDAKHTIDLTSEEFKLDCKNKEKILFRHCENNAIEICSDEDENYYEIDINDEKSVIKIGRRIINEILCTDPILGFPFACYLFCCERKYTQLGEKFFTKPTRYLIDEIRGLINSDSTKIENVQYCIMAYMVLKNGKFDAQLNDEMFNKIITSLEFQKPTKIERNEAIKELLSRYIVKGLNSQYEFKHQTILESVAVCFTEVDPCLLLELCSEDFITEFVRPHSYTETEGEVVCKVESEVYNTIVKRILYRWKHVIDTGGMESWEWPWLINHPLLNEEAFVECLFSKIKFQENDYNYKLDIESLFEWTCEYGESTLVLDELYKLLTPSKVKKHNFIIIWGNVNVIIWQLDHNLLEDDCICHSLSSSPHVSLINHPCVTLDHVVKALYGTNTTWDSSLFGAIFNRWPDIDSCHVITMLELAILFGMPVDSIQTVLKCRPDMITDVNIKRMFTLACVSDVNNIKVLEYLLNIKHDNLNSKTIHIYTENNDKLTNLHIAAYYGKVEVCKKLVELGLRLDDRTVSGLNVLQMVILGYCHVQSNSINIQYNSEALDNFCRTIYTYSKCLAHSLIMEERQIQTIYKHQLEYMMNSLTIDNTDFDLTVDEFGSKLVHYCVLVGDLSLIEKLYNINHQLLHVTNNDNMSGIHIAALFGRSEIFMKLVEFGVSVTNEINGLSVLQLAMIGYSHHDLSVIDFISSFLQDPIIEHYTRSNNQNYGDIITFLLQHEKFIQTDLDMDLDGFGSKLFHYCVLVGDLSLIGKLYNINHQLVHVTNNDNMSGIHIASLFGLSEIFMKLVELGVSVPGNTFKSVYSALYLAMVGFAKQWGLSPEFQLMLGPVICMYNEHFMYVSLFDSMLDKTLKNTINSECIITFLLEHKDVCLTDLDMGVDVFGTSFTYYCVVFDSLSLIKLLYQKYPQILSREVVDKDKVEGAAIDSSSEAREVTPVELSVLMGRSAILQFLLSCPGVVTDKEVNNLIHLVSEGKMYVDNVLNGFRKTPNFLYFVKSFSQEIVFGSEDNYQSISKALQDRVDRAAVGI